MGSRRADTGSIQREAEGLYKKRLKGVWEALNCTRKMESLELILVARSIVFYD